MEAGVRDRIPSTVFGSLLKDEISLNIHTKEPLHSNDGGKSILAVKPDEERLFFGLSKHEKLVKSLICKLQLVKPVRGKLTLWSSCMTFRSKVRSVENQVHIPYKAVEKSIVSDFIADADDPGECSTDAPKPCLTIQTKEDSMVFYDFEDESALSTLADQVKKLKNEWKYQNMVEQGFVDLASAMTTPIKTLPRCHRREVSEIPLKAAQAPLGTPPAPSGEDRLRRSSDPLHASSEASICTPSTVSKHDSLPSAFPALQADPRRTVALSLASTGVVLEGENSLSPAHETSVSSAGSHGQIEKGITFPAEAVASADSNCTEDLSKSFNGRASAPRGGTPVRRTRSLWRTAVRDAEKPVDLPTLADLISGDVQGAALWNNFARVFGVPETEFPVREEKCAVFISPPSSDSPGGSDECKRKKKQKYPRESVAGRLFLTHRYIGFLPQKPRASGSFAHRVLKRHGSSVSSYAFTFPITGLSALSLRGSDLTFTVDGTSYTIVDLTSASQTKCAVQARMSVESDRMLAKEARLHENDILEERQQNLDSLRLNMRKPETASIKADYGFGIDDSFGAQKDKLRRRWRQWLRSPAAPTSMTSPPPPPPQPHNTNASADAFGRCSEDGLSADLGLNGPGPNGELPGADGCRHPSSEEGPAGDSGGSACDASASVSGSGSGSGGVSGESAMGLDALQDLVAQGIPVDVKYEVWDRLSRRHVNPRPSLCADYFTKLVSQGKQFSESRANEGSPVLLHMDDTIPPPPSKFEETVKQIDKDISRTFPRHPLFSQCGGEGQQRMRDVLIAYAQHNPRVGYCQSMNFLCGLLLVFMDEEQAFWMLHTLVDGLFPDYYTPGLDGALVDIQVLRVLLLQHLPRVHDALASVGVDVVAVAMQWFMCLYVNALPVPTALRVWDFCFLDGPVTLFRVALAVFKRQQEALCSIPSDCPEEVHVVLDQIRSIPASDLMRSATSDFGMIGDVDIQALRKASRGPSPLSATAPTEGGGDAAPPANAPLEDPLSIPADPTAHVGATACEREVERKTAVSSRGDPGVSGSASTTSTSKENGASSQPKVFSSARASSSSQGPITRSSHSSGTNPSADVGSAAAAALHPMPRSTKSTALRPVVATTSVRTDGPVCLLPPPPATDGSRSSAKRRTHRRGSSWGGSTTATRSLAVGLLSPEAMPGSAGASPTGRPVVPTVYTLPMPSPTDEMEGPVAAAASPGRGTDSAGDVTELSIQLDASTASQTEEALTPVSGPSRRICARPDQSVLTHRRSFSDEGIVRRISRSETTSGSLSPEEENWRLAEAFCSTLPLPAGTRKSTGRRDLDELFGVHSPTSPSPRKPLRRSFDEALWGAATKQSKQGGAESRKLDVENLSRSLPGLALHHRLHTQSMPSIARRAHSPDRSAGANDDRSAGSVHVDPSSASSALTAPGILGAAEPRAHALQQPCTLEPDSSSSFNGSGSSMSSSLSSSAAAAAAASRAPKPTLDLTGAAMSAALSRNRPSSADAVPTHWVQF
eukprot:Rmarinus@m.21220